MSEMPNSFAGAAAAEATEAQASARKPWSTPKIISSEICKDTSGPTFGAPETTPSIHTS